MHKSPKLEHLVIDHNKLTVPLIEWQKYGNNVHLSLAENPWHCDCPMLLFINSILNEGRFHKKMVGLRAWNPVETIIVNLWVAESDQKFW